MILYLPLIIDI